MTTVQSPQNPTAARAPQAPRRSGLGWIIPGIALLLIAVVVLISGVAVRVVDGSWRRDGYLTSGQIPVTTTSYAIATERLDLEDIAPAWPDVDAMLGDLRLRATGSNGPIFIGVAPADRAEAYLNGVGHATLTELEDPVTTYADHPGGAPQGRPADQNFWVASATGTGVQVLDWPETAGTWTVVIMNADGSAKVDAVVDVGITAPVQDWAARFLLNGSALLGVLGVVLVVVGISRRRVQG